MKVPDIQIPADWTAKAGRVWGQLEKIAYRYGALILLVVAICYYGQYYRSGAEPQRRRRHQRGGGRCGCWKAAPDRRYLHRL